MDDNDSLFINAMQLKSTEEFTDDVTLRGKIHSLDLEIRSLVEHLDELQKERETLSRRLRTEKQEDTPPLILESPSFIGKTPYEKASFLLSLLSPRKDVYAIRRCNKETGKVSYFPQCVNFWHDGCLKKEGEKGKAVCSSCTLRQYVELTSEVIIKNNFLNTDEHGTGAIGIYPLKEGDITRFVAVDLDEKSWEKDAKCLLRTARNLGLSMLWERSFSGQGAHLWVLFSEDIPSSLARELAFTIIDKAREDNANISLSSYDRLFPSQDTLQKGGIGNLILLPLVSSAARRGCTLFLDEEGNPYPADVQLEYLSSVHRHTLKEVQNFLALNKTSYFPTGSFRLSEEDMNPIWGKKIPKLSSSNLKGKLIIYLSSGISFDKQVISTKMQEALRRFATISNPEYYKNLSKYDGAFFNIASRIPLYEENERVLKLPRGLMLSIRKLMDINAIKYEVEDHRVFQTGLVAIFKGNLRWEQKEALTALLKYETGILSTATGFGKTVVALALIAERKERTMIIVSSTALLKQWEDAVNSFLEIRTISEKTSRRKNANSSIGIWNGSKKRLSGVIDIVMLQSLASSIDKGEFDFASEYGMVIVDECHHIAAEKSRIVLSVFNSKYVYGLSATVKRRDGLERIVYSQCGSILFSYDTAKLSYDRGIIQKYKIRFLDTVIPKKERCSSFTQILDLISTDIERTRIIVEDIKLAYESGRNIIVFTRRLSQNNTLAEELDMHDIPYVSLDGKSGKRIIETTLKTIKDSPHPEVIIATDMLLGEGVDIPSLDTLFLASPYMQERVIQQCIGRLSRIADGKQSVLIYDYVDYRIPKLSYMFTKRLSVYRKLGCIPYSDVTEPYEKILYDDSDFLEMLISDISKAKKDIIFSTSYLLPSSITKRIFKAAIEAQVIISLRGKSSTGNIKLDQENDRIISQLGLSFMVVDNPKNYIVVDGYISWYGEINVLGRSKKNEGKRYSIMRILDKDTACSLIEDDELLV